MRSLNAPADFRAGFCAIGGLPNVGKSTLLNRLIGQKLSIVTPKAQTTRNRLLGIYTDDSHQAVFVDTPGLVDPRYLLQEVMREDAEAAIADADLLIYVVDAGYPPSIEHARAFSHDPGPPGLLCLNKLDRVSAEERSALEKLFAGSGWEEVIGTVATDGRGVDRLREETLGRLPESPPLYPPDDLAVAPVRFFVAEIIRETVFELLSAEVPYASAVTVDEYREPESSDDVIYVQAVIHVERESQKGIVIGSSGKMIRRIGTESRGKIEEFLERRIYLDLRVKVLRNWRKREGALNLLGVRRPQGGGAA